MTDLALVAGIYFIEHARSIALFSTAALFALVSVYSFRRR